MAIQVGAFADPTMPGTDIPCRRRAPTCHGGPVAPLCTPVLSSNTFMPNTPDAAQAADFPAEGGCDCGAVRYRMTSKPLFVHCCHCKWCQRESGASFALNAMIESDRVVHLGAEPELVHTPSDSGQGQRIARCATCRIAIWSHYAGSGPIMKFVRVGTLDHPDLCPPEIHIFTRSKQPWVNLQGGAPAVAEYYEREDFWPADSLRRREAVLPAILAYQAALESDAAQGTPPK